MANKPIMVTRPYLPPLSEFVSSLEVIWANRIVTNGGPFHRQLEEELSEYLRVPHVVLFSNATIALIAACRVLGLHGEVITTPYSFVATSHALRWNGLTPVFVDIDRRTLNLDVTKIRAAASASTSAIMPVHCYGRPCDVDALEALAEDMNLRVIYDAAHAFGVNCHCGSLLNHGDLSVLSFHATKVFNTFEGGAIICHDRETKERIEQIRNFGFIDEVSVASIGINGKMTEISAALGLLQLRHMPEVFRMRRVAFEAYNNLLASVRGVSLFDFSEVTAPNYSYFPIIVEDEFPLTRDALYERLREAGIFARRYFYPLISNFPSYSGLSTAATENLPVANWVSNRIICLPLYPELERPDIERIVDVIREVARV
jgi:dTDP-4-amino-4,6-dideoxygalactose transaminase